MLPRSRRVTKKEFDEAFVRGQFFGDANLNIKIFKNKNNKDTKFSFVVPIKEVKKAHERNFLKRRAKYVVLKYQDKISQGFIYLFFLKKSMNKIPFGDFEEKILLALKKTKHIEK